MKSFPLPEEVKEFGKVFQEHGHHLYVVGGSIRDALLGVPNHDYDFTTDAIPQEVQRLFRRVIPTGIEHGTVTVLFHGQKYEVTTFRTEGAYLDMRHPSSVTFVPDLAEDLSRRDFTINAFAADCISGQIIDLYHGREDLKDGVIRAIGEPRKRFQEDALRILRALRFAAKLDFTIEPETFKAMGELKENLSHVSEERIHDELTKMLCSPHPAKGLPWPTRAVSWMSCFLTWQMGGASSRTDSTRHCACTLHPYLPDRRGPWLQPVCPGSGAAARHRQMQDGGIPSGRQYLSPS
jgi:tRNA nucleotidyltransferase/poly(A) polymerase